VTELKAGTVFLLRTAAGARVVVKRSDAPFSEVAAAALGRLAGVRTVPARPVPRHACPLAAGLPFSDGGDGPLLMMPWVPAPTLARARVEFNAYQLGRLWAFDVLIDNGDRLVKGGNPFNILVAGDGSLFALDQRLGPAVAGRVDAARVTRRRLRAAATPARARALAHALFADFRAEAGVCVAHPDRGARAFARGVAAGVRSVARLRERTLRRALAAAGVEPHVEWAGFAGILRQFREVAR
jgi:hypothetical protein